MIVTPHSEIMLLNVPIDNTYRHTLYFPSVSDQTQYFISRVIHGVTDCTYVRQQASISYPDHIDNLLNCNYVMYQNPNYSGKWFYAFITDLEYRNDETTYIHIEQDVLQTWQFDIIWKSCYIEREHTKTDEIGEHIISENLDTGENVVATRWIDDLGEDRIVLALAKGDASPPGASLVDIYSPLKYYSKPYNETGVTEMNELISDIVAANESQNIVSVFMVKEKMNSRNRTVYFPLTYPTLDGYTPKNNKMHTFPFSFLQVRTITGDAQNYRYEFFKKDANRLVFQNRNCITINPVAQLYPDGYRSASGVENYETAVSYTTFPQCGWITDVFSAWYAANRNSVNFGTVTQGLKLGANIASLNLSGILNSLESIGGNVANMMDIAAKPPQLSGQFANDAFAFHQNLVGFIFEQMTIKSEYAKVIDDYFTIFGYKTLENKIPTFDNRPVYTYVKMLECNLTAPIPNKVIDRIKSIMLSGCTWWKLPQYVGDYSVDNSVGSTPDPGTNPPPEPEAMVSPIFEWWNYVSSEYGNRQNPITGAWEFHNGIDIARPQGTTISVVLSGTVTSVINSGTGYGNHVYVKHANGMTTLYAHCHTIGVTQGMTVSQGDVIASVGSTGQSTGNHLHFTVYLDYNARITDNPRKYLPTS